MADLSNTPVTEQSDKTNANNIVEDRSEGKITSNVIQSLKKDAFSNFLFLFPTNTVFCISIYLAIAYYCYLQYFTKVQPH